MIFQAVGFAFLAALSPTALLVLAVCLATAEPRRTAGLYLAGAIVMSAVMAIVLLIVVRWVGLEQPVRRDPRYGVRLGLGVLALAGAAVVRLRPAGQGRGGGLVSRLITEPTPVTAFLAGMLVFAPGLTFVAAVQVIATARAGTVATAVALILVIAVSLFIVWMPMIGYLLAPGLTTRRLAALNGWLRTRGKVLAAAVLAVVGIALVVNGIAGLAT